MSDITDDTYDENLADDKHVDEFEQDDRMFRPDQVPRLAEDGASPAAPAKDVPGASVPIDYPQTDTNVDSDEKYQEGFGIASGTTIQHENADVEDNIVADAMKIVLAAFGSINRESRHRGVTAEPVKKV